MAPEGDLSCFPVQRFPGLLLFLIRSQRQELQGYNVTLNHTNQAQKKLQSFPFQISLAEVEDLQSLQYSLQYYTPGIKRETACKNFARDAIRPTFS